MPLFSPMDPHPSHHHPAASPSASSSSAPFFFRRRTGKLNWSQLSSVSLSSIISTVNVDLLQEHVELITYADINESDLAQATDAQILHLIRLAQLTIEYLLNVQNFLLRMQRQKQRTYLHVTHEMDRARVLLKDKDDQLHALQQENRFLKKLNKHLQAHPSTSSKASAFPLSAAAGGEVLSVHTCEWCRASFVSEVYLAGHIGRRHPEMAGRAKPRKKSSKAHPPSDDSDSDASTAARRRRKEEDERARAELQRLKDDLDAERRKLQQERDALDKPPTPAHSRMPSARPAPIDVALSKEWLEKYTAELEARVRQETMAAIKAQNSPEIAEKVNRLQSQLDSVLRGDHPLSPSPAAADGRRAEHLISQTKEELLREIAALKKPPPQSSSSPRPLSPRSPPRSPASGPPGGGRQRVVDAHRLKRFASFSDFPQLLSRFQHEETDLQRRVEAFSAAVEGMVNDPHSGEAERWVRRVEDKGYEEEEREVADDVERIMEGFVDHGLEQRWHDLLQKEKDLDTKRRDVEERRRERDRAERQAQAQAHTQRAQQLAQAERERAEAQRREQLQQQQQSLVQGQQSASAFPQSFAQQQTAFGPPHPLQQSTTVAPAVPPHPQPRPAPSVHTTDIDALLRRQQEQSGVIDELRRKLQPADAAVPMPVKAEAEQKYGEDVSPSLPVVADRVSRAKEEMSEEEMEDDSPMPAPVPTQHHLIPPPAAAASAMADDVESIDLEQPPSPQPAEQKEADKAPVAAASKLSPIKRVGGGFVMPSAAQRGAALPALSVRPGGLSALPKAPAPAFATSDELERELELEEEEF